MICRFCEEGTLSLTNRDIWGAHVGIRCECDNCGFIIEVSGSLNDTTVEDFLVYVKETL